MELRLAALWQMTIPIERQWYVVREWEVRPVGCPAMPSLVVSVVLQVEYDVLLTAAADEIDVVREVWIIRHDNRWLPKRLPPEVCVEFPITEVVG